MLLLEKVLEAWARKLSGLLRSKELARGWGGGGGERQREKERERERKTDTGTYALMEERCFIQHSVGIYTVLQGSYFQQR